MKSQIGLDWLPVWIQTRQTSNSLAYWTSFSLRLEHCTGSIRGYTSVTWFNRLLFLLVVNFVVVKQDSTLGESSRYSHYIYVVSRLILSRIFEIHCVDQERVKDRDETGTNKDERNGMTRWPSIAVNRVILRTERDIRYTKSCQFERRMYLGLLHEFKPLLYWYGKNPIASTSSQLWKFLQLTAKRLSGPSRWYNTRQSDDHTRKR